MRSIRGIGRLFSGAPISLEELNGGAAMRQGSRFERDGCQNWDCSRICGRRAAAAIYQLLHNFIIYISILYIYSIDIWTPGSKYDSVPASRTRTGERRSRPIGLRPPAYREHRLGSPFDSSVLPASHLAPTGRRFRGRRSPIPTPPPATTPTPTPSHRHLPHLPAVTSSSS